MDGGRAGTGRTLCGAGSWELLAGAGEQKCKVCKYVDCTFTCTHTYSSQDETDGLLVILFIVIVPRPVKYVVWCHVQLQIGGRGTSQAVGVDVGVGGSRESCGFVCLLGGEPKKISWRGGETKSTGGVPDRLARPGHLHLLMFAPLLPVLLLSSLIVYFFSPFSLIISSVVHIIHG